MRLNITSKNLNAGEDLKAIIEKKLDKLKEFYTEGLNEVGWNKYDRINIEFEKQVICTKKNKQ